MSVVLQATWVAAPGAADEVRAALAELAPLSRAEPGNLLYQVYQDPAEPRVFRIFEIYADAESVAAHAESAHFAEHALGRAIPLLSERRREFFETLDL
jgi:quinol monooxygenase YgiN